MPGVHLDVYSVFFLMFPFADFIFFPYFSFLYFPFYTYPLLIARMTIFNNKINLKIWNIDVCL